MNEERSDYQLLRRAALIARETDVALDAPAETVLSLLDENQQLRQLMTTFVQAWRIANHYDESIGQHVSLPRGYIDEYVRQFRAALGLER